MRKFLVIVALSVAVTGCVMGPQYRAPDLDLPTQWPEQLLLSQEEAQSWRTWWNRYEDPVLERLVDQALEENLDIRLQLGRIQEARARLGLATANRWPTLDAQAEAVRQRQPAAASFPIAGRGSTSNTFSVLGLLGYELDLWGRVARQQEAATALAEQSVFSHDAVRLNVVSDVVNAYINLRAAQQQLAITERTLESRYETLRLQRIRYEGGAIDQLALYQAASELEATRARIPGQREQVRTLESALAALTGMAPAELVGELDFGDGTLASLNFPDRFPESLPSELLRRRPDIRASEALLMASTAEIGIAVAERLPRFNLAGFYGSVAGNADSLLTGPAETWGVGASVVGSVFDFGRGRARVEASEALRDQAETRYRITVQTAFREVRDTLLILETTSERVMTFERMVSALQETRRLATVRYEEGFSGFIEVLDAERALLEAELALTEAIRDRLNATAALFKAMGGGW